MHKPTFFPARGREDNALGLPSQHVGARDLPQHGRLKERKRAPPPVAGAEKRLELLFAGAEADPEDADIEIPDSGEPSEESDAGSSDDDEALARELEALRRERTVVKSEREQNLESLAATLQSKVGGPSKDWTEEAVFSVRHVEEQKPYVNDTIRSEFHQRFLQRYIR